MKLFSPEDWKNASDEEKEVMLKHEKDYQHHLEGELNQEYERVLNLLNKHDKDTKNPSDAVILVSSKKIPFFNPNYKLNPEYLKFCEYSIFTSKQEGEMMNFEYDYIAKQWRTTKDNKRYFPVDIKNIPSVLVHKRTEINKIQLKKYLSLNETEISE